MSLQVWLPLNGSLENLGLDSFNFTQSIASGYEDGKIGKALQMKNSNVDFIVPSLINAKEFSVAFWYKAIADSTITTNWNKVLRFQTKNADGTSGSDFRFESSYAASVVDTYGLSVHNNTSQSIGTVGHQIIGSKGSWHHACFTHTPTDNYSYLDGVQIRYGVGAAGTLTGRVIIAGASPYPNGLMNDLRIYDHALSQKEVKELSKGLVAHYPLNDFIGNPNLLKNTTNTTPDMGWARAGVSVTTIDVDDEGVTTFSNTTSTTLQYGRICQWIDDGTWATVNGKTVTISFDIYSDDWNGVHEPNGENSGFAGFAIQIARSNAAPGSGSVNQQQYVFRRLNSTTFWYVPTMENGKWIHFVSKPFVINEENLDSSSSLTTGDYVHIGWQLRMQGVVKLKNLKVEYGSVATPWIPNVQDDLYSALGLDDDIIYDCSGYGHNGVSHGPVVGTDPPRYKTCTSFDGTNDYIDLGVDTWLPTECISVAMWVYMTVWGSSRFISCTESGGWNFEAGTGGGWRFPVCKAGIGYCYSVPVKKWTDYTSGWHHIVGTFDGYVSRIYIDGEFDSVATNGTPETKAAIRYNESVKLFIGCEAATANPHAPYFDGKISDVRIYATALSAEDIKTLYETSVSIDDKGNFHAYEISEV